MACGDACGSGTFGGLRRRAGRCERSARRFWRGCGGALCHQRRDGGAKRFAFAQRFGHGAHSERNPGLANGSCAYAVRHEQHNIFPVGAGQHGRRGETAPAASARFGLFDGFGGWEFWHQYRNRREAFSASHRAYANGRGLFVYAAALVRRGRAALFGRHREHGDAKAHFRPRQADCHGQTLGRFALWRYGNGGARAAKPS